MSERRLDRLVNPLVSNLPAFLATDERRGSGFMIAQYTAVSLVGDNRRLAAPASPWTAGSPRGLQEDHLSHATPGAIKLLKIIDNTEIVLAIELLAAAQAYELQPKLAARARPEPMPCIGALAPSYLNTETIVPWAATLIAPASCSNGRWRTRSRCCGRRRRR
jgi:histidine ammonia-lyase